MSKDDYEFKLDTEPVKVQEQGFKQPTLFEINQSLDYIKSEDNMHEGIKGEYFARMVVFTNFVLGRKPVLLIGSRSSGKTCLINVVRVYIPKPIIIASSSDKADFHDFENINEASHIFIPEINKVNDVFIDIMKDLGEGVKSIYKFTDYDRIARTITINPKPFITSIASENKSTQRLGEELISRLTRINTDSSVGQNLRVIRYMLDKAQNPYKRQEIKHDRIQELIEYVKGLPCINEFTFIYLPGKSVIQAIPPIFTDSRRDTQKYIANTNGIALFHLSDRIVVDYMKRKNVLITPADAWLNHRIYNEILIQSSLKLGPLERVILDIIRKETELLSAVDIRNLVLKQKIMASNEVVKKACEDMTEVGYLTKIEEQRPFKYALNPVLENDYVGWINWKEVVEECKRAVKEQFIEYADEYVKRFCGNKIFVIDPFTGEKIDILDQKIERPKQAEPQVKTVIQPIIKKDDIEIIREKIMEIVKKEDEIMFDDLYKVIQQNMNVDEEIVEEQVNYLRVLNELLYVKGKIKLLE